MQDTHLADVSRRARASAHVSSLKAEQRKLQGALTLVKEDTDIFINSFLGEQQKVRQCSKFSTIIGCGRPTYLAG